MIKIPITRFQREFRKWLRLEECVAITRCGKIIGYMIPHKEYELMNNLINK